MTRRVWLSIGSNLGDRLSYLQGAVDAVRELGPVRVSKVYETDPVDGPEQPDYLNAVIQVETSAEPRELLQRCQEIEQAAGRERIERWGARTLDVDIIGIEGVSIDEPDLHIPHERAGERAFVLIPLADLVDPAVLGLPAAANTAGVRFASVSLHQEVSS